VVYCFFCLKSEVFKRWRSRLGDRGDNLLTKMSIAIIIYHRRVILVGANFNYYLSKKLLARLLVKISTTPKGLMPLQK
jgi:hypothetical protein